MAGPRSGAAAVITLGLDLGTSAVKALLVDEDETVLGTASVPLETSRPHPLWSEQDPEDWWTTACAALDALAREAPEAMADVGAIGLSGQMHGATLLDAADTPIRPAILWNDGRAHEEAAALAREHPELAAVVGVAPMPGLTAPKLAWLARHQPEAIARLRTVLLPKDWLRLRLTGERATDMSDASGTWWLDVAARDWSDAALAATGLDRSHVPRLVEGTEPAGRLRAEVAARFGMRPGIVVAGGGGDAAAAAVGLGMAGEGEALVSLGTSAQLLVAGGAYRPAPGALVHAFCHALPARWTAMAAMLTGASALAWAARLFDVSVETALEEVERETAGPSRVMFLPYLTGERTPHDDPHARGVLFGLDSDTRRADAIRAVLDGVALSFVDARVALASAGIDVAAAGFVGGGARSRFWGEIIASALGIPLTRYGGSETGPAFGAARLARIAATGAAVGDVVRPPPVGDPIEPVPRLVEAYAARVERFRALYGALRGEFRRRDGSQV